MMMTWSFDSKFWTFNKYIEIEKTHDGDFIVWNDFIGYHFHTFYDAWTAAHRLCLGWRIR